MYDHLPHLHSKNDREGWKEEQCRLLPSLNCENRAEQQQMHLDAEGERLHMKQESRDRKGVQKSLLIKNMV